MAALESQAQFEELFFNDPDAQPPHAGVRQSDRSWIVYFTAAWCKPCKNLDIDAITALATEKKIPFYICDNVTNDYTGGYCGVRAFPTFLYFQPKVIVDKFQSSNTEMVISWMRLLP